MSQVNVVHYLPVLSTIVAAGFARVLYAHWQRSRARYLFWWFAGVVMYGIGTFTEAFTTIFGWNEPIFRAWYITGALLGGVLLAQGTVYLLLSRRTADRLTTYLAVYITIAAAFVLTTPVVKELAESHRLDGDVMQWQWVRLFSPLINLYALVFLAGGAAWSAWRYRRQGQGSSSRVRGNALIALGALLPGIGGSFTRAGYVEVLYVAELLGLVLIWLGYRAIVGDGVRSIHAAQVAAS